MIATAGLYDGYRTVLVDQIDKPPSEWTFKANPAYRQILEHVSPEQGREYIAVMQAEFPTQWHQLRETFANIARLNDSVGTPILADYPELGLVCSPTNLRYACHALMIVRHIQALWGGAVHIIEIGGGYGGLALYLRTAFPEQMLSYTIVDLPEACALQWAYAAHVGLNARTVDSTDGEAIVAALEATASGQRFLISAYAFSELTPEWREWYERHLLPAIPHGWLAWNFMRVYPFVSHPLTIEPEYPLTGMGNTYVTF